MDVRMALTGTALETPQNERSHHLRHVALNRSFDGPWWDLGWCQGNEGLMFTGGVVYDLGVKLGKREGSSC